MDNLVIGEVPVMPRNASGTVVTMPYNWPCLLGTVWGHQRMAVVADLLHTGVGEESRLWVKLGNANPLGSGWQFVKGKITGLVLREDPLAAVL